MKQLFILLFLSQINLCFSQEVKNWTIMHYSAGSNSSEIDLLDDIGEMKQGKVSNSYNLITLIDRIDGYSEDSITLDGNFNETRLYEINTNSYKRLDGMEYLPQIKPNQSFEANMADVLTLKGFIQYCKKYYPAKHYMLVLRSHGNGVSMCPDAEDGNMDRIYPGEISNVLSEAESVDILGLDVCSMAGLENLYEWRTNTNSFSADFVIASAPLSGAWAYDEILKRLTNKTKGNTTNEISYFSGDQEINLNPATMTPIDFSKLIFEEIYDNQKWASWGLFDNSKIELVKSKIDDVSKLLYLYDKQLAINIIQNTLGYHHNTSKDLEIAQLTFPYVDSYHFWTQISNQKEFGNTIQLKANEVCKAIDDLVVYSYYGRGYLPTTDNFTEGKSGIYQIIPKGNQVFSQTNRSYWSHCGWLHPDDKSSDDNSFGQYDWCIDGATRANQKVDNFYEYLDFLFDESNDKNGGINSYQW